MLDLVNEYLTHWETKDEEFVFCMTYALVFAFAVRLIVVDVMLSLTVMATSGQTAHSVALRAAHIIRRWHRSGKATGEVGESDDI